MHDKLNEEQRAQAEAIIARNRAAQAQQSNNNEEEEENDAVGDLPEIEQNAFREFFFHQKRQGLIFCFRNRGCNVKDVVTIDNFMQPGGDQESREEANFAGEKTRTSETLEEGRNVEVHGCSAGTEIADKGRLLELILINCSNVPGRSEEHTSELQSPS